MAAGMGQGVCLLQQIARDQSCRHGSRPAERRDRQIGAPISYFTGWPGAHVPDHPDLRAQARVPSGQSLQGVREQVERRAAEGSHVQRAGKHSARGVVGADFGDHHLVQPQDPAGVRGSTLTGRGGCGAGAGAVEEHRAELALHAADGVGDSGLGHAKSGAGGGEAALVAHGQQDA
ncbi:hypothetical protein SHKM778_46360 [Streptomyces sp. KM77-8]|uniref:Uncharacterized protein n=1 Tax=Streptomyces haneummycinicus TaxID=3074435 RepID=A0AAT9HM88_9ACTN